MTPAEIIRRVHQHGGRVNIEKADLVVSAPRPLAADLLQKLRERKVEVLAYLNVDAANDVGDPASEERRQQVLAILVQEPGIAHAIVTDDEAEQDVVIVTVAIRGKATCELHIPRERYGLALLEIIEKHTGAIAQVRGIHWTRLHGLGARFRRRGRAQFAASSSLFSRNPAALHLRLIMSRRAETSRLK